MKEDWHRQSIGALQLAGKGEGTQQCCTRSVRMLVDYCGKAPHSMTEDELEEYFPYRRNDCKRAPSAMQIRYCGIRFFLRGYSTDNGLLSSRLKPNEKKSFPLY